jgi:hypothetical protein
VLVEVNASLEYSSEEESRPIALKNEARKNPAELVTKLSSPWYKSTEYFRQPPDESGFTQNILGLSAKPALPTPLKLSIFDT